MTAQSKPPKLSKLGPGATDPTHLFPGLSVRTRAVTATEAPACLSLLDKGKPVSAERESFPQPHQNIYNFSLSSKTKADYWASLFHLDYQLFPQKYVKITLTNSVKPNFPEADKLDAQPFSHHLQNKHTVY